MIKKVMVIGLAVVFVSLFGMTKPASAHFIVEDSRTGFKALFHVTPEHDPIAGEESVISFDFSETGLGAEAYSYTLAVKSTKDEAVTVPLDISGDVALAGYVFPSQGFYDITLTATSKADGSVSKLHYGQRVSRGTVVEENKAFGPLEIAAVGGVVLIAAGAILFSVIHDNKMRKEKRDEKGNRR